MANDYFGKPAKRAADPRMTDALMDDGATASTVETIMIHKSQIYPDSDQVRRFFSDEMIEKRRVQMEENGQESPITVWPGELDPESGKLRYMLHDGECRWRASMQSDKIDFLRAEIRSGDRSDVAHRVVSQLLHNDDGAEPLTPLERAYAYKRLLDSFEVQGSATPKGDAAKALGISASQFSETLSLASLDDDMAAFAMEKGIRDARVLSQLTQVNKRGTDEDLDEAKRVIVGAMEGGENLRVALKGLVDQVKARKSKAKAGAKAIKSVKKSEKALTQVRAKEGRVTVREDGSAKLVLESARAVYDFQLDSDVVQALKKAFSQESA